MQSDLTTRRKILYTLGTFVLFSTILLILEFSCRVLPPSKTFSQIVFFNQFKISRWEFLSARHEQLNVDWVLNVIAQRNANYQEPPEPNRPAFDRVPYPYSIQTNAQGFRDKQFPMHSSPSVLLLGDSVGFGKGVEEDERFFSILNHQFPHMPFYNLALQGCTADCMTEVFEQYVERLNPTVVILQASSNDIDQTLWREGIEHDVPNKPVPTWLKWHSRSHLTQYLQGVIGDSVEKSLDAHSQIVEHYYQPNLDILFKTAATHNVTIVTVNLPFAYEWNYGGHTSRIGKRYTNATDVTVRFKNALDISTRYQIPLPETRHRFDLRTAEELDLSVHLIQHVFPNPEFFLDVVHLTPLGHRAVAEQIYPTLKEVLSQTH